MRLVVPSWLVPGGWLENLKVAAGLAWASGVELLFFSFEGEDRELFLSELPGLQDAVSTSGLSLSVHLPDPLLPAHEELVGLLAPIAELFVLHPPPGGTDLHAMVAWRDLVEGWRHAWGERFLLEYTEGSAFEAAERASPGLPICADTGRLLIEGIDPAHWIAQRAERVKEIHLHGLDPSGTRDHKVFMGDEAWLESLRPFLAGFLGRVELEVFSLESVNKAAVALKETS